MSQPNAQTVSGTVPSDGQLHRDTSSGISIGEAPSTNAQASTTAQNVPNIDYVELSRIMMPGLVQGVSNILGEQIRGAITELKDDIRRLPSRQDLRDLRNEMNDKIDGLGSETNERIEGLRIEVRDDIQEFRHGVHEDIQGLRDEVRNHIQAVRNEVRENMNGLRQEVHEEIQGLRYEIREEVKGLRKELQNEMKCVREEAKTLRSEFQEKIQDLHEEMHEQLADVQLSMHSLADANMDELHNTVSDMQDDFGGLRTDMHRTFDELRKDTIPVIQSLSNRLQDTNFRIDITLQRHVDSIVQLRDISKKHGGLLTEVGLDIMKMGTSNSALVERVRVTLQDGLNDLRMKMAAMKDQMRNDMASVQNGLDALYASIPGPARGDRGANPLLESSIAWPVFATHESLAARPRYTHCTTVPIKKSSSSRSMRSIWQACIVGQILTTIGKY